LETLKQKLKKALRRNKDKEMLDELESSIILTKKQATSLYVQIEKEWLNRDDYEELNSAVQELGKALKATHE
jgi:hypothetical protein